MALASLGGPLPCGQSTQRLFEPFCFFLQADPAEFAYQPCPIMRYLRGNSCRNFFVCVSRDMPLSEDAQTVDTSSRRVGKESFLQGLRDRTFDVGQIVLPADFLVRRNNLKSQAA
jgi:hypothetical protein